MSNVAKVYDKLASTYDATFVNETAQAEDREIVSRIKALDLSQMSVLDLGCGTGFLPDHMKFWDYTGLDISEGMIARAQEKHPLHDFQVGDMADLSCFAPSIFRYVLCTFGGFSYVMQPEKCIDEIYRVLQPGGRIFLQVLGERYYKRRTHIAPQCTHLGYTPAQLRHLFRAFDEVTITGMNWLGDQLPWSIAWERPIARRWPQLCYYLVVEGRKA